MDCADTTRRKWPKRRRKKSVKKSDGRNGRQLAWSAHLKDFCNDETVPRFGPEECLAEVQQKPIANATQRKRSAPRSSTSLSLLHLLRQRELASGWTVSKKEQWQSRMLNCSLEEDQEPSMASIPKAQKGWRPYASRSVPFSAIITPENCNDAILAIDRHGSYALALSDRSSAALQQRRQNNGNGGSPASPYHPVLALTFYGIPSPSSLRQNATSRSNRNSEEVSQKAVSPLLQTVTLLTKRETDSPFLSRDSQNFGVAFSTAFTEPTNILISSNWEMGAAFLLNTIPATYMRQNHGRSQFSSNSTSWMASEWNHPSRLKLGTILIFSCPRHVAAEDQPVHTLKLSIVRMGSFSAFTMRNLLWNVNKIPSKGVNAVDMGVGFPKEAGFLCKGRPGYLLFNDEYDGFRLAWITDSLWRDSAKNVCVKPVLELPSMTKTPGSRNIVVVAESSENYVGWENCFNERQSGIVTNNEASDQTPNSLSIAFEAYLSIRNILEDMLLKRPNLAYMFSSDDDDTMPDYCYNLLSVNDGGRTADFVIVCKPKHQVGCIAVFVTIDLFTQQYHDNLWLQKAAVADRAQLRKLCDSLALNRRMRQRKIGPYAIDPDDKRSWEWLLSEKYFYSGFDFDMEKDLDPTQWKPFLDFAEEEKKQGRTSLESAKPKAIPFSSLYPDCELATNRTISAVLPAAFLTGRRSPLKILYC